MSSFYRNQDSEIADIFTVVRCKGSEQRLYDCSYVTLPRTACPGVNLTCGELCTGRKFPVCYEWYLMLLYIMSWKVIHYCKNCVCMHNMYLPLSKWWESHISLIWILMHMTIVYCGILIFNFYYVVVTKYMKLCTYVCMYIMYVYTVQYISMCIHCIYALTNVNSE